jgi:hypothetical protein
MGRMWRDGQGNWNCEYHGVVTIDAAGKASCGCAVKIYMGVVYSVPRVDRRRLPHAGREDAK